MGGSEVVDVRAVCVVGNCVGLFGAAKEAFGALLKSLSRAPTVKDGAEDGRDDAWLD